MKNFLAALLIAAIAGVTTQSCDCKKPCDCEPCEKTAWTAPPAIAEPLADDLLVGAPPDILHLSRGTITAGEPLETTLVAIAQYTEPQPPPSPTPRPPQLDPPAGRWETQWTPRGRRARAVWIPAAGRCR